MTCEVHLLVMIHGMWGTPINLMEVQRVISEKHESLLWNSDLPDSPAASLGGTRLNILVTQTNQSAATYDGVDWGAEKLADEVYERIAEIERDEKGKVTFLSVVGYSLGGLIARYLLGILHSRKFFDNVKPVNFTTFASPHIGLLRYRTLLSTFAATLGSKLLSRTGEQFYGADKWGKENRPLLEVMADKDRIFWRALSLFPHIHIYANAVSDTTVPFVTAAIELKDPFLAIETNELDVKLDPKYGAIVQSYEYVAAPPKPCGPFPRSRGPGRPILPPFLQRGPVFEATMFALSPILLPVIMSRDVLRLARESRASRSRIQSLEADESNSMKLINMLDSIESAVEHAIDPINAMAEQEQESPLNANPPVTPSLLVTPEITAGTNAPQGDSTAQPALTDAQTRMVHALNDIPQLNKHYAFFHPVRNSHALIICRDLERAQRVGGDWAAWIRQGEGVLRHWADEFVV